MSHHELRIGIPALRGNEGFEGPFNLIAQWAVCLGIAFHLELQAIEWNLTSSWQECVSDIRNELLRDMLTRIQENSGYISAFGDRIEKVTYLDFGITGGPAIA